MPSPGASPRRGLAEISGRTALVTGAGRGLGRCIAAHLAAEGAKTILAGRNLRDLEEASAGIRAEGGTALVAAVDVADPDSVARLGEELAHEGVSILINNAGVPGPVAPLVDTEPDDWDAVFAVNVRGPYLVCRAFVPGMVERKRGDIINIASVSGKRPLAGRSPYCASKMAVIGMTLTLAAEVGSAGVTVNSLSPGPVRGPRMERNFRLEAQRLGIDPEEAEAAFVSRSLLGRMIEEEEVAAAVVAMLAMPGLHAADIDLSAGMVGR